MFTLGIETYLAVVNTGSMSRAAQVLNCAQTTVSKRIKSLEDDMNMPLLERGKGHRSLRLTPAGEEFFKLAQQWNLVLKEARILKTQGPRLALVMGAVDSMNSFVLPPLLRALHAHRPALKLEVQTLHSEEMYGLVESRHLDVAFCLRERNHPGVLVERFFSSPMVVLRAAQPGRRRSVPSRVAPQSLDPNEELFVPWGQAFEAWHDRWWDPTLPSRVRIDSMNILLAMLTGPKQWAVVPEWMAQAAVKRGDFTIQRLEQDPPDYVCYRLTHKQPTRYTAQALEILQGYVATLMALPKQGAG